MKEPTVMLIDFAIGKGMSIKNTMFPQEQFLKDGMGSLITTNKILLNEKGILKKSTKLWWAKRDANF